MHKNYREQFNLTFTKKKYKQLHEVITELCGVHPAFRVAESPVFVPDDIWNKVVDASRRAVDFIVQPGFKELSEGAFPMDSDSPVPNETPHPQILSFDFGICEDKEGNLVPKLIEFQGFPTLCTYQLQLYKAFQRVYPEIAHLSPFIDVNEEEYLIPECALKLNMTSQNLKAILRNHSEINVFQLSSRKRYLTKSQIEKIRNLLPREIRNKNAILL